MIILFIYLFQMSFEEKKGQVARRGSKINDLSESYQDQALLGPAGGMDDSLLEEAPTLGKVKSGPAPRVKLAFANSELQSYQEMRENGMRSNQDPSQLFANRLERRSQ